MNIEVTDKILDGLFPSELFSMRNNAMDSMAEYHWGRSRENYDWYFGKLPKPEIKKGCKEVIRMCSYHVDGALQDLYETFTARNAVRINPVSAQFATQAQAATDLVNSILFNQNDGSKIIYATLKEALICGNAFVKVSHEKKSTKHTVKDTTSKDENEVRAYLQSLAASGIDIESPDTGVEMIVDEDTGKIDLTVTYRLETNQVVIEHVPLDNIMVDCQAIDIKTCSYICHREFVTKKELLDYGFPEDEIDALSLNYVNQYNSDPLTSARTNRRTWSSLDNGSDSEDKSAKIWLNEHYVFTNLIEEGDQPNWYRVMEVNDIIFKIDLVDTHPFINFCPIPTPSDPWGESLVEKISDIQRTVTKAYRYTLDHAAYNVYGRYIGQRSEFDEQDLVECAPGGVINVNNMNALALLPTAPLPPELQYIIERGDEDAAKRTGVNPIQQGDSETLAGSRMGLDAINTIMGGAKTRIRLYARTLANTAFKDLIDLIYNVARESIEQDILVQTANGYVPVNPQRDLPPVVNVTVNVALTQDEMNQQLQKIQTAAQMMNAIAQIQHPLFGLPQLNYMTRRTLDELGFKNQDDWCQDLATYQPPQPQPDPAAMAQAEVFAAQAENIRASTQKLMNDANEEHMKNVGEQQLAADRLDFEREQERARQQLEADKQHLAEQIAAQQAQVDYWKQQHEERSQSVKEYEAQIKDLQVQLTAQNDRHAINLKTNVSE